MEESYVEVRRAAGLERVALSGEQLTVGRDDANDIAFPADDTISTHHAVLERSAKGWGVRDVGSTNGTFVNGQRLAGEQTLEPGDEIVLGHSAIVFRGAALEARTDASYLDVSEEWSGSVMDASPSTRPQSPPPRAAAPTTAVVEAPGKRGAAHVRGVARNVQTRRTQDEREILALRVDRYDAAGNRLVPVAVEYHGYTGGQIGEGEEVEATGRWKRGTLRAARIVNLSTASEIRGASKGLRFVHGLMIILVLGWILFIAFLVLRDAL